MMFASKAEDGELFSNERVVEVWKRSALVTADEVVACLSTENTDNRIKQIKINVL